MIQNKKKAIALSKYRLAEYLDYFEMLYRGIILYQEAADMESAEYCRMCMAEIPEMLEEVLSETDPIAWNIFDKPELALPDEYTKVLEEICR